MHTNTIKNTIVADCIKIFKVQSKAQVAYIEQAKAQFTVAASISPTIGFLPIPINPIIFYKHEPMKTANYTSKYTILYILL